MGRRIVNVESFSVGKNEFKNDDDMYIGNNFAAVIDGVSNKSSVIINGKKVRIAEIITEAIRKLDRPDAPVYAKALVFEDFVRFINLYIKEYLQRHDLVEQVGKMEATGVIYSKFHNQIWLVGDCRAIYDGKVIQNPLKIDEVYIDIRKRLIQALLQEGNIEEKLIKEDVSRDIIKKPQLIYEYILNPNLRQEVENYRDMRIRQALLECGFTETMIELNNLVKKYYNPRDLQQYVKNNPNVGPFGYAIFNGIKTETKNCKVVTLPENVKTIKMFSDGFPVTALKKDIGYAVRSIRKEAKNDILSIGNNSATHNAVRYSKRPNRDEEYSIDDATAIIIGIEDDTREKNEEVRNEV